ncbi:efflux RND transporter permease subunit [Schlesneria paludicola]|uniref:efflux RND transporter permease subunit n=1 Tax=Schlesneria paludicola TaxID=360056 RepID=UPI00029AFE0E|nr:efflux RND transporter permease subunit [Schlesneria paludicola]
MNGLIRASLRNPYAVTVGCLTVLVIGVLTLNRIPIDILPVFRSPAVQTLTFYGGMPAEGIEKDITNRMERWTGQASGVARQESRSMTGASIVRNFFQGDADPNGALTQVNSLALAAVPTMPPGTLPPVVLPYDPTSTTPVSIVALNSKTESEATLYDVGRYEVRSMIMSNPGAISPVVYGGRVRAVMLYLDRIRMAARGLAPVDVMNATDKFNIFLPTGTVKMGDSDYAVDSNSMIDFVERMGQMPLKAESGNVSYIRDVATPTDSSFVQTNIVRVDGRRQVYIPVFRQTGASTLTIVDTLKKSLDSMQSRLTRSGIELALVMDQSVYVRSSISALVQEGLLGAVLCSLVILLFLGQWRMTLIAILTLPLSVLGAVICLYATGNTINVMTLAGLALAIGPMVDSAIICLENTHRHLGQGVNSEEAAFLGASEVALPELVSTLCTFLVLAPLALMPGMGQFLFRPMAMAVAFAMISAYILSRTLVPAFSSLLLKPHAHHDETHQPKGWLNRAFHRWEQMIDGAIAFYVRCLDVVLRHRLLTVGTAVALLVGVLLCYGSILRREFFPEVDSGAFEMIMRGPSGLRIERTEEAVAKAEALLRESIDEHDLQLIISEIGVVADWSAAYTPNAGPMDAVLKVQLSPHRHRTAQHYVSLIRDRVSKEEQFSQFEFGFDSGGMIRSALNEGKSNPIRIRITGKQQKVAHQIASAIKEEVSKIDGVVDARILQRLNYPQFTINVDRVKTADLGLSQEDVMRNVVAAANSSISFNKKNFWIDPVSYNQYFVGVIYPEQEFKTIEDLLDIPITGVGQKTPVSLRSLATISRTSVPTEISHTNLQASIDLVMSVSGRDLGHVSQDVYAQIQKFGVPDGNGAWNPYDPRAEDKSLLKGSKIVLSGEYSRMQDTFSNLGVGLILASLLMYFLMVALVKSWVVPLTVMLVVPLSLVGILPFLYHTGTALSVQSLLGIIFIVGIKVANTVLLTDYAQELRRHEGLSPTAAIRKSASVRVRPVTMTALAAFFAMIPAALAIEHGSEANAPLARAILGGLLAGEPSDLFVLPALYSLLVRDRRTPSDPREMPPAETAPEPTPSAGQAHA